MIPIYLIIDLFMNLLRSLFLSFLVSVLVVYECFKNDDAPARFYSNCIDRVFNFFRKGDAITICMYKNQKNYMEEAEEKKEQCGGNIKRRKFEVDWSSLPLELSDKIISLLPPLLMLADGNFFDISNKKIHHIDLPQLSGKRCFGSSHGWLGLVEEKTISISLFNPFTNAQIQLPPINTLPETKHTGDGAMYYKPRLMSDDMHRISAENMSRIFLTKLILSENPITSNNYVVMVKFNQCYKFNFGFCRVGDSRWWVPSEGFMKDESCDDAIYHKGLFYCVGSDTLSVYNPDPYDPKEKVLVVKAPNVFAVKGFDKKYLVEVFGKLILVVRYRHYLKEWERCFYVYQLEPTSNEWIAVTKLGDCALFLGKNCSLALSTTGDERNCIHFSDDWMNDCYYIYGGLDQGIYNLKDGSFEELMYDTEKNRIKDLQDWRSVPIWIIPSLLPSFI